MQMKKIMIVEDEKIVRERLKEAIHWSEEQVVLAGEAGNGVEALGLYKKILPDILFVDIKMPVMDGIQFTEQVKKINPQAKIVLLTAFSDFKYARKAVNLKVEEYVLKYELDSEKINGIIRELIQKINQENNSDSKQSVLRRVLFEMHSREELGQILKRVGILWNDNSIYLCSIKGTDDHDFINIYQSLKKEISDAEYRWVSEDSVVLFCPEETAKACRSRVVMEQMASDYPHLLFIDSGRPVSLASLQKCYFNILKTAGLYLFFENKNLISIEILNRMVPFTYDEELNHIFVCLRERKFDEAAAGVRELLGEKAVKSYNMEDLERCLDQLTGGLFEELNRQNSDIGHSHILGIFKQIHASTNINQIILILTDEIEKLKRMSGVSRKMCQILTYIEEHYQSDITLEELADKFNWNPSYLSQTFRKEMNVTFKQYLNDVKIEKAKKLLLEGQLSVEQIADQVGYSNVNYFYRIFKKHTGKKPREFV